MHALVEALAPADVLELVELLVEVIHHVVSVVELGVPFVASELRRVVQLCDLVDHSGSVGSPGHKTTSFVEIRSLKLLKLAKSVVFMRLDVLPVTEHLAKLLHLLLDVAPRLTKIPVVWVALVPDVRSPDVNIVARPLVHLDPRWDVEACLLALLHSLCDLLGRIIFVRLVHKGLHRSFGRLESLAHEELLL